MTSGDILQASGHQLYRVKSGDPIPPNAVIVGVSGTEGSLNTLEGLVVKFRALSAQKMEKLKGFFIVPERKHVLKVRVVKSLF